jgi:hypothetical protein|tara:strand:- start:235 stop:510 length:276 start_codon:yes stop_codon:yes gene_type:complete
MTNIKIKNLNPNQINILSDETITNILPKLQLVSGKQLSIIFSKKNDNWLRKQRSLNYGFTPYYFNGKVYYNLPECLSSVQDGNGKGVQLHD